MKPWFADGPLTLPSLHVVGDREPPGSLERVRALSAAFANPRIISHESGHIVPRDAASVADMVDFIVEHCRQPIA